LQEKLDPVIERLSVEAPDARYDRQTLSQMLLQLIQFMEDVMGKGVSLIGGDRCERQLTSFCNQLLPVRNLCAGRLPGAPQAPGQGLP
jgi:hypothetical protein